MSDFSVTRRGRPPESFEDRAEVIVNSASNPRRLRVTTAESDGAGVPPEGVERHVKTEAATRAVRPRTLKTPALAKIVPPPLPRVYERTRLFEQLDQARESAVIWLTAPGGIGKTTLVASYLKARKLPSLWYRLDVRDADPAVFFHYLREALQRHAPHKPDDLAAPNSEVPDQLPAFAQNFFEQLYARMRSPAVLVLDNFQALPDDAPLHQLLPHAFGSVPEGVNVIVTSRHAPPASLAFLELQQSLRRLGAANLELTLEEAAGLSRLHCGVELDAASLGKLYAQVHGWTAGWTLLLKHLSGSGNAGLSGEVRDTLFRYFATELFERASDEARTLLLKTSFLPQIPAASAAALTGLDSAPTILAALDRQSYFSAHSRGAESTYRLHPLFREFLRVRANVELPVVERRELQRRAAELLDEQGDYDEAAALLIEAEAWADLTRLIVRRAPTAAEQGHRATLDAWLRALPPSLRREHPWIAYWLGVCSMAKDLREAREWFEHAYGLFKVESNPQATYSALAGVLETCYYLSDDLARLDHWFRELDSLQRQYALARYPDIEARVVYAVIALHSLAGSNGDEIGAWVRRAESLLQSSRDPRTRVLMASALRLHYVRIGDVGKLLGLHDDARHLAVPGNADPLVRLHGCWVLSRNAWLTGDHAGAEDWVRRGLEYGEQSGVKVLEHMLFAAGADARQAADDVEGVARYVRLMRETLSPDRRIDLAHYLYHAGWLAMRAADYAQARTHFEQALAAAAEIEARFLRAVIGVALAGALGELDEAASAASHLYAVERFAERTDDKRLPFMCALERTWSVLRRGRVNAGVTLLRYAFGYGREHDLLVHAHWLAPRMSVLCSLALRHGIEVAYVHRLIRLRGLLPDERSAKLESWPYAVKLRTFGGFTVLLDDNPLEFAGKAQKKPLELLKGLIAFGGRDVNEEKLATALWPLAGDSQQALATTLYRLRRLIGDDAIERKEGTLSINPQRCWIDTWAMERHLAHLDDACKTQDAELIVGLAERLIALYGEGFLTGDADATWALLAREKWRTRMLHRLDAAAAALARLDRHDAAIGCYRHALEIDPLSEALHAGLIRSYLAADAYVEALSAYRRCREILTRQLGVAPSASTEALTQQIKQRMETAVRVPVLRERPVETMPRGAATMRRRALPGE